MNNMATNIDMYETSFKRPKNFLKLSPKEQWSIDAMLGILDWDGEMTDAELERFNAHYKHVKKARKPKEAKSKFCNRE